MDTVPKIAKPAADTGLSPSKKAKLLERVAASYHQRFLDRPEGRDYLVKARGIRNLSLFRDFRLGYADGSLLATLPQDADGLAQFQAIGILDAAGREVLTGCVVFPVFDATGTLVELYGRRITDAAPAHVWLTGAAAGLWNKPATRRAAHLLVVGSMLDALTLIDRGMADVLPCLNAPSLNADQLAALSKGTVRSATLLLRDDPGEQSAAQTLTQQLAGAGIASQPVFLPDGLDANAFLQAHEISALQALIPTPDAAPASERATVQTQRTPYGVIVHFDARRYEVKAFVRQGTQLKATIKASGERVSGFELHTLDLYSARSREGFAVTCAALFGEPAARIKTDLDHVLEQIEAWTPDESDAEGTITLSDSEREAGLALLQAPDLLDRIENDLTTLGIAGEGLNKRLCYLAAVSRRLDDPLSLLVQSRSAAGKSALQNAVVSLVPDEDKVVYTRLTDQSLFYQNPTALKHKLLVLEEAEGLGGAAYSLRALQSSKQLAIATTSKDAMSGKMKAEQYLVQGPVAVLLTTTSAALDEETASRFLTVTIDESAAMTERIFACQREADTLAGYLHGMAREAVLAQHHAAQRLLEPLTVINPYAPQLQFPAHSLRARRDHKKYLMLIKAIAFLHQKQRPVRELLHGESVLRYIEVTREDIRAANAIAATVLGQSADELSAPARSLLGHIHALVKRHCAEQDIAAGDYAFTRKTIRDGIGWSDWQVRTHIGELEALEYLRARSGAWGKEYSYELIGEPDEGQHGFVLADPDRLQEPTE